MTQIQGFSLVEWLADQEHDVVEELAYHEREIAKRRAILELIPRWRVDEARRRGQSTLVYKAKV